jgi:tRNA G18 (ribose-2'-O)-methylase SpoU
MPLAGHIIPVASLEGAHLHPYRTLRRPADHWKEGIFVAEGEKVVERLLASPLEIISVLATEPWLDRLRAASGASRLEHLTVYLAAKELMEEIVGFNLHQGIMAVARVPSERPLEATIRSIPGSHLLVALDGLVNAENVGVVVRNCAAFGVDALIVGETSSSPYLRRAVRNSMGTVFGMRIVHVPHLPDALSALAGSFGTRILGTCPGGASALADTSFSGNACIVLGNEGDGISAAVLERCTERVAIPMLNDTDSLNVASASAVVLYEARRLRDRAPRE